MRVWVWVAAGLLLGGCSAAWAQVSLPQMWSDHAVVQRDRPLRVWGTAKPGARLQIEFHEQKVTAEVNALGAWATTLMPEKAGGPYVLRVDGDGHAERQDVMVGDVWVASGQSNMEIPLKGFGPGTPIRDGAKEIAAATHPEMRLMMVARKSADMPEADVQGAWTLCTPQTAAEFSAVAYFFGRKIAAQEHVTVGLIDATWGGTPADAWVSLDTLGRDAQLLPALRERASFAEEQAELGPQIAMEKREDEAARAAGRFAPQRPWRPFEESWIPGALFNGMIAPLTRFSIRGVIWYQGESNSSDARADDYAPLFQALIEDWRMHFGQGAFPFLFVQISSSESPGEHWGMVRDAQRRALRLKDTAMAVSLDVGSVHNVHPPDKQTVAERLARAAEALSYGQHVAYQGPLLREVTPETGALRVWFDHAEGLQAQAGAGVQGFEIAGRDHKFVPASAELQGETVVVRSAQVSAPAYVRYLWANFPPAPLRNGAGLPASTFSSEWYPQIGVRP